MPPFCIYRECLSKNINKENIIIKKPKNDRSSASVHEMYDESVEVYLAVAVDVDLNVLADIACAEALGV